MHRCQVVCVPSRKVIACLRPRKEVKTISNHVKLISPGICVTSHIYAHLYLIWP